jgi:hypothetical protein
MLLAHRISMRSTRANGGAARTPDASSDQGMEALLSMRLRLIPGAGSSKTHSISSSFLSKKSSVAMMSSGGMSGGGGKSIRICSNDDGPSKAEGQSPTGGTAPAGMTAPAMGRQARMETNSSRRAFNLDPLCWAARCETRHKPCLTARWPPASCRMFAHLGDVQTRIRGGSALGPRKAGGERGPCGRCHQPVGREERLGRGSVLPAHARNRGILQRCP